MPQLASDVFPSPVPAIGPLPDWLAWAYSWWAVGGLAILAAFVGLVTYRRHGSGEEESPATTPDRTT